MLGGPSGYDDEIEGLGISARCVQLAAQLSGEPVVSSARLVPFLACTLGQQPAAIVT